MQFGFFSGLLWGLDTVILGIGLALAPYIGSAEALACASIAGSFLHDAFCAIWLFGYMGVRGRLKTRSLHLKLVLARSSSPAHCSVDLSE